MICHLHDYHTLSLMLHTIDIYTTICPLSSCRALWVSRSKPTYVFERVEIFSTHEQDDEISEHIRNITFSAVRLGGLTPAKICNISLGMLNLDSFNQCIIQSTPCHTINFCIISIYMHRYSTSIAMKSTLIQERLVL